MMLKKLRGLAAIGQGMITGKAGQNRIASALIQPGNRELHGK
jgi:hypothetical protein